jgi:hypothetical protein
MVYLRSGGFQNKVFGRFIKGETEKERYKRAKEKAPFMKKI